MLQPSIYDKTNPFIINNAVDFTIESREDDVEEEDEEESDDDGETKGDEHEGVKRMPDSGEDIFPPEENISIAECF